MRFCVDRIEGDVAVLSGDGGETVNVPLASLPEGVREGDVLRYDDGVWVPDPDETARRAERVRGKLNRLFKK